jgi:hypothetical protein
MRAEDGRRFLSDRPLSALYMQKNRYIIHGPLESV